MVRKDFLLQLERQRSWVRFVPASKILGYKRKNGSINISGKQLAYMFYRSKFNRDNLCGTEDGEDINDSCKHRLYTNEDLKEIMILFFDFLAWALTTKNLGRINITNDMSLIRMDTEPRVKYATTFDENVVKNGSKAGEYYITPGRYEWKIWFKDQAFEDLKNLWMNDPYFVKKREDLIPEMEEKNRNVREKNKAKSAKLSE